MAYAKSGDLNKAKAHFEQLEKLLPNHGLVQRNWALYYVLKGEANIALDHLAKAVELGYEDLNWITTDEALQALRKEQAYLDIVQQLKAKLQNANQ